MKTLVLVKLFLDQLHRLPIHSSSWHLRDNWTNKSVTNNYIHVGLWFIRTVTIGLNSTLLLLFMGNHHIVWLCNVHLLLIQKINALTVNSSCSVNVHVFSSNNMYPFLCEALLIKKVKKWQAILRIFIRIAGSTRSRS